MASLGIDVGGLRKGLDVVLLSTAREVLAAERGVNVSDIPRLLGSLGPAVVAIDSPSSWASGSERATESFIRGLGLHLYQTPWQEAKKLHPFYEWMKSGFDVFHQAERCGFPLFDGGPVEGHAIEVFPYASAAVFSGARRPPNTPMRIWRRRVLYDQGLDVSVLKGPDQIDAAMAALTGLMALTNCFCYEGDPLEGVIVLPCRLADLPNQFRDPLPI